MRCAFCRRKLNPNGRGVLTLAVGWIDDNRRAGGANGIRMAERRNEYAHSVCVDEAELTATTQTERLFEG